MKSDLDTFMAADNLNALLITGAGMHNPAMVYLTGGAHLTQADLIVKKGQKPVLFHGAMERDEAAKSGLPTRTYSNYPYGELLKTANGDPYLARALRYQRMFNDVGVTSGKVALYGRVDIGQGFAIISALQKLMPEIEFLGGANDDVLFNARYTKDAVEIERIRQMGKVTTEVVGLTADFLSSQPIKESRLCRPDGQPWTIGDVKKRINLWLAERGAENPEDTIFAIGHDSGVPHSSGNPADILQLGQTIVFDIYPCEMGGGYFYDFTRTWCLGFAPDEAQKLYDQVRSVYQQLVKELKVNAPFKNYQQLTCELFESVGHPTILSSPDTEVGYVHSIGHGVGLNIHERPFSGSDSSDKDILSPGTVITIEPGLYYPEQGMGVRLEDTYWVNPEGKIEILADFPMDLVLPVRI
ncbi:MAG TPA: M24 family metallopeptidase [Anaerolineaceae bacterium]|nr:M24 family metallopeptidase [Anaerolineaceae bacterium]